MTKLFAIVTELKGEALSLAKSAWLTLEENDINFVSSRSVAPHITFALVKSNNIDTLVNKLTRLASTTAPLVVNSNGLGIYIKENPVLYIRWRLTSELLRLKSAILKSIEGEAELVDKQLYGCDWQAKTTLANKDIIFSQLGSVIQVLKPELFYVEHTIKNLSLYQYDTEKGETPLFNLNLQG